jgi:amino acid transporter
VSPHDRRLLGFWEVASIGVGGMVGGGIFAVLGLAVALAGGATAIAFAIAGFVALLTAYSYAKLSVRFPSQGGTIIFLDRAFGIDLFTGGMNVLLWISYVVMLALYAFAFGSYGATFFPARHQHLIKHVLICAGIIVPTLLNMLNAKAVGKAESYIVGLKLALLGLFVAVGLWGVDPDRIGPSTWAPPMQLIAGGMIIFLAYEGFELIANTAQDVRKLEVTLPRAYFGSVGFVIALYVLVAVVTVGNLPLDRIVAAKDYALAEAARPFLGATGFTLIAVAALLSTFSAINATLYGSARLSYMIAKEGELPSFVEHEVWNKPLEGLLITSVLALLLANTTALASISMMGSAGFLLIFAAVNAANLALARQTGARRSLSAAGVVACLGALAALVWQTARTSPSHLWALAAMACLSFGIEAAYRVLGKRRLRLAAEEGESP